MKRLLVLNFFPAFVPPTSGGELRYFHIYSRLSQHFDITLLSPTFSDAKREMVTHSPTFREHRIPKEAIHDRLHMEVATEDIADEISALVCSLSARYPNEYHQAYLQLQHDADCIVHESPYMLEYDLLLGLDGRPRIYNSYNVESDLVAQVWRGPHASKHLAHIADLERRLLEASGLCFAVSETEVQLFAGKFGVEQSRFRIAENGIDPLGFTARKTGGKSRPDALFFGSFHPPNIEAAEFILKDLAPACPEIDFVIAGNCLRQSTTPVPGNVRVLGRVEEKQRLDLFSQSTFALNPMFSGGGTNLKALEYLAAGMPMVTTRLGARGLDLDDGRTAVIAERSQFANALKQLVVDGPAAAKIAVEGKAHAIRRFSWDSIAARTANAAAEYLETWQMPRRRRLMVLNDFSAAAPRGGGEVRINRLYSLLALHYQVTLVCFTNEVKVRREVVADGFVELWVPKTEKHRALDAKYSSEWHISAADIVNYAEASQNKLLVELVRALHARSDVIVLCHPYMVKLLAGLQGVPVIYESLNVETDLKREVLAGHPSFDHLTTLARQAECEALNLAVESMVVSDSDIEGMVRLGVDRERLTVVPNGVDVPHKIPDRKALDHLRESLEGRPFIIFVGSAHPPNIDAASHILHHIAPHLPNCIFGLVGSVCNAVGVNVPSNAWMLGVLEEHEKNIIVELADIALNPMLSGSGSNLKLADYFAKGLPTITTDFGARGYVIENEKQAIVCRLDEFPRQISRLLDDSMRRAELGRRAYQFARAQLSWALHASEFRGVLERRVFGATKRKLLVVTFRFTDPPLGGAESYLLELVHCLDRTGQYVIDVATFDIVGIENQFHFSCKYTCAPDFQVPAALPLVSIHRFPVEHIPADVRLAGAREIFKTWMDEHRAILDSRLISKLPDIILLGGWYYPERAAGQTAIWSSTRMHVRVKGAQAMILKGSSPIRNTLIALGGGRTLLDEVIQGEFEVRLATLGSEIVELKLERAFHAPLDARELGVRIHALRVETIAEERAIDLSINGHDFARHRYPEQYIAWLIEIANSRSESIEQRFQSIRGPNSNSLTTWLAENANKYDLIIGHGAPFNTLQIAAQAATAANVPLLQIPHVHVDDDFYHWRLYFDALRKARLSVVHPQAAIRLFFDRIGAKAAYLPHGLPVDAAAADSDKAAFSRLYGSALPYFLVLGRKDRAKNYHKAISAVRALNGDVRTCNLVMIGRDEDGDSIEPSDAIYLEGQPRGIVLAALKDARALVSMSDSESFGIVILEAWSQATPVIVSDGCIASCELVTDGENGLLANDRNLSDKMRLLLNSKSDARRMGDAGRRKLCNEFSWEVVGAQLHKMLSNVLSTENERAR